MANSSIHTIWAHPAPHWDDLVAIILLQEYGESHFLGIKSAKVDFLTDGNIPEGLSEAQWLTQGNLLVGTGNGMFDEHLRNGEGKERQENECATTLVAKHLGFIDDPRFAPLVKYTLSRDTGNGSQKFEIAALSYLASQYMPTEQVLEMTRTIVLGYIKSQEDFWGEERDALINNAEVTEITSPRQEVIKVATVRGEFNRAASIFRQIGYGVLIQERANGQVMVAVDERLNLPIGELAKTVRFLEQVAKDRPLSTGREAMTKLEAIGECTDVPEWFVHPNGAMLLNGSRTKPDIPATALTLEIIRQATRTAYDASYFCSSCPKNRCLHDKCTWFKLGLLKCRSVRMEEKRTRG